MSSVIELGLGLGLAGAAGIRTYLPLIIIGLLTRYSQTFEYRAPFKVFASVPVLLLFLVLAGYELFIEKSDEVKTQEALMLSVIRAMGGAILLAGLFGGFGTFIGLVLGGVTALAVHLIKVRLRTNLVRQNNSYPILTFQRMEDFAAMSGVLLVILVPWSSYIILVGIVVIYLRKIKHINHRYRPDSKAKSWR